MSKGSGAEAITERRTRSVLSPGDYGDQNYDVWQIVTEQLKGDTVCARTAEVYQSTPVGDLLLARVEGYNSDSTQSTEYSYDGSGNLIRTHRLEDKLTHEMAYDSWGRLIREITPWGPGGAYKRIIRTTYAFAGDAEFNSEPEEIVETIDTPGGTCCYKLIEYYSYTTSEDGTIRRVERERYGCEGGTARHSVTETYTGEESNIYARGRVRMEQAENGVQTWHEYAACSDHGALYTETVETRVNGAAVNRHSTRSHASGQVAEVGGTGQRALLYREDIVEDHIRHSTLLPDGETLLSEQHLNGFDDVIMEAQAVPGGFLRTLNTYNAKGQLTQTQQDDGTEANAMAPTEYNYDEFGNLVRETLVLAEEPSIANSRITIYTYSKLQEADGGIYSMVTTTHNNSAGGAYTSSRAQLISELSATLESKSIETDPRGKISTSWTERGAGAIRTQKQQVPTSTITATYEASSDNPATITNAQGKTISYRYDLRGRKLAEWGSATQPATYSYDEANRLLRLTTFRVDAGDITTDPSERTDGDSTTWSYDPASGLELSKTYADNSTISKTYDGFGRLATETNARGMVRTLSYLSTTGELAGIVYADDTWYCYGWDLTKNICEVFDHDGTISNTVSVSN